MASVTKLPTPLTERATLQADIGAEMMAMLKAAFEMGGDDATANLLAVMGGAVAALTVSMREILEMMNVIDAAIRGEEPSG